MNNWQLMRLSVLPQTPIHCGDRPMGFVSRTLSYIPGHIPVMAMVPVVVRELDLPDRYDSYMAVLKFLKQHIRFTPLFIEKASNSILIPHQGTDKIYIEANWLSSSYGVAISYPERQAKNEHLFEIEAIQPVGRDGKNLTLQGYVFWREPDISSSCIVGKDLIINESNLMNWIRKSQWGGERNNGYGKIGIATGKSEVNVWGQAVDTTGEHPTIAWPETKIAPINLLYDVVLEPYIKGEVRPQVGREYDEKFGFGQCCSACKILWNVGWTTSKAMLLTIRPESAVGSFE